MSYKLNELIALYQSDEYSYFNRLGYRARIERERQLKRLDKEHGRKSLRKISAKTVLNWYGTWVAGSRVASAYKMMGALREVIRFGVIALEDTDCNRLFVALKQMRFQNVGLRNVRLTAAQATMIREKARAFGYHSIALAQALQFELMLSQKDVIGEWLPMDEPDNSEVQFRGRKWVRGLHWPDIGDRMTLTHRTGSGKRIVKFDLRTAPMVQEELLLLPAFMRRESGPMIVCEATALPWEAPEFRRKWRMIADNAGIPKNIRNMDSKPAGIIIGGPHRARSSRQVTMNDIHRAIRTRRDLRET
jgi:hypothetical protein